MISPSALTESSPRLVAGFETLGTKSSEQTATPHAGFTPADSLFLIKQNNNTLIN